MEVRLDLHIPARTMVCDVLATASTTRTPPRPAAGAAVLTVSVDPVPSCPALLVPHPNNSPDSDDTSTHELRRTPRSDARTDQ